MIDLKRVFSGTRSMIAGGTMFLCAAGFLSSIGVAAVDSPGAAQAEKKVVVYHTTTVPDTQQIIQGFKKKYPFADVEGFRSTGEKVLQKVITEVKGGQNLADVYMISGLQIWQLKDMGLLIPYRSAEREKVYAALRDKEGFWTGVYWNLEVLGYNTGMVSPASVPKRWDDLLNPRWKGQIAIESDDVYWYSAMLHIMGEEKGKSFARQLAKQNPQVRAGHTLIAQLLAAGEFALTPTIRTVTAEDLKSKAAPVEWLAIEPLAPNPPVSVSLAKSAPHPHLARLFIDYAISQEGQKIIAGLKRNPTRSDVTQPIPRVGAVKLIELDHDARAKNNARYTKEFNEIFGVR